MIPYIKGVVSRQAHVNVPDGLYEEEVGRNGFFGRYAHLYRENPPVGWSRIEGPLKPQLFDLQKVETLGSESWLGARQSMLFNDDVHIKYFKAEKAPTAYFRNADGDELWFCHAGAGVFRTDFGPLEYEKGDYVVIPRGTMYAMDMHCASQFLLMESPSELNLPDKGVLGQHALFDPAMVTVPEPYAPKAGMVKAGHEFELQIQHCGEITKVWYPYDPLDVVGWKGTLSAWKINVRDIRPISCDRYHLPPTAHITFVAHNFVVCSFLPRPLENGDPKAMKVPFYHSNIDFDEVLFYHDGDFFSRTGIAPGMLTFHPQGIHHGPQDGAVKRSANATHTQEVAVMIDTKRPLKVSSLMEATENKDYWQSWKTK
jgi:homogentisate 1,2-dioxygenase